MKKILVSIHDDWELLGNGLGNVASHQYLPSLFLMEMADKHGIKPSFMVDVAQGLNYQNYISHDKNIKLQYNLWKENIRLIKKQGHDVQLHIHPQWLHSTYEKRLFFVDSRYNIGLYNYQEQKYLVENGIELLKEIIYPIDSEYSPIAFKAGGWGIQPSLNILNVLAENDIQIILGPRKDLKRKHQNVDFTTLQEPVYCYYPDFEDINKVSQEKELFVVPLSFIKLNYVNQLRLLVNNILTSSKKIYKDEMLNILPLPEKIKSKNSYPLNKRIKEINPLKNEYLTHLKIGGKEKSYNYLKSTFDEKIKYLLEKKLYDVPIIIESHTKNFRGRYKDIDKFFKHITTRYNNEIEFIYLSDLTKPNNKNKLTIKSNEKDRI